MVQTAIPRMLITRAPRRLAFYVDRLGFVVDWQHPFEPGSPLFFQLTREGQTRLLTEHAGDREMGAAVYFRVPDAEACHTAFAARGMIATLPPSPTPWGTLEFLLTEPDGNRLRCASDTPPPAQV